VSRIAVIAVGGNSLIRAGEPGTIAQERSNARRTARAIVEICRLGWRVVITHGNGPQVGAALARSEDAAPRAYAQPLDVCDATTQGEIGYLLQQAMSAELAVAGLATPVATVLTQVVVNADDPAMLRPTKPIGPWYDAVEAERRRRDPGWRMVEDARHGWRRVVASPEPVEIVEEGVIRTLVEAGVIVIAVGGGGIPVVRTPNGLRGVDAVIDKDRASALLASRLGCDLLVISTDTEHVCLNWGKPGERVLRRVTAPTLARHHAAGQFPPGSMGPKVESALRFIRAGGREVIITSFDRIANAVCGSAGTHVVAGGRRHHAPRRARRARARAPQSAR
jgi:carbamate kinase